MTLTIKYIGATILMLSVLIEIGQLYPSTNGCQKCRLVKNDFFSIPGATVHQCMGCCFSRAYPTPLRSKQTMAVPKNITSEATCCVARETEQVIINNIRLTNHSDCHCSTCYYHKD